jgi:hypothetical protein
VGAKFSPRVAGMAECAAKETQHEQERQQ